MTKYSYKIEIRERGAYITVTRLLDGATKEFFQAGVFHTTGLDKLMISITDDQADGYFPRPRKEKEKK